MFNLINLYFLFVEYIDLFLVFIFLLIDITKQY